MKFGHFPFRLIKPPSMAIFNAKSEVKAPLLSSNFRLHILYKNCNQDCNWGFWSFKRPSTLIRKLIQTVTLGYYLFCYFCKKLSKSFSLMPGTAWYVFYLKPKLIYLRDYISAVEKRARNELSQRFLELFHVFLLCIKP